VWLRLREQPLSSRAKREGTASDPERNRGEVVGKQGGAVPSQETQGKSHGEEKQRKKMVKQEKVSYIRWCRRR